MPQTWRNYSELYGKGTREEKSRTILRFCPRNHQCANVTKKKISLTDENTHHHKIKFTFFFLHNYHEYIQQPSNFKSSPKEKPPFFILNTTQRVHTDL